MAAVADGSCRGENQDTHPITMSLCPLCLVTAGVLCNAEVVTSLAAAGVVRSCGSPDLS